MVITVELHVIWVVENIIYCIHGWHKEKNKSYIFMLTIFLGLMFNGLTKHAFDHPIVMKWFWFGMGYVTVGLRCKKMNICEVKRT